MKTLALGQSVLLGGLGCLLMTAGCSSSKPSVELSPLSFESRPGLVVPDLPPEIKRPSPAKQANALANRTPVGATLGQFQTLGGVVAEVNGNPIYANKVLKELHPELSARALEMDESQFRTFATAEIKKKIQGLERDELVFGAADRNLVGDDRKMAEYLTMQWRTRQITEAGGSAELAQRKAQADGSNFDDLVWDRYRLEMSQVFYRRKVIPRIQVSADDLRTYYNVNLKTEFTEQDEVTFRLIKIDTRKAGSPDAARKRAQEILAKAQTQNFAELARTMNDDPRLAKLAGEEVPLQRGAYRLEKVEKVLWETTAGKLTPIIEDTGGLYIAKIEARKTGKVLSFDDRAVQDRIQRVLSSRQFRQLTDEIEITLRKQSMVRENAAMQQTAIEMAMQNYGLWAKARASIQ
jgi:parvulin-like peptidyl-prolyl isomerase